MIAFCDQRQMENLEERHVPVLRREVLEYLDIRRGDCIVDCTLGLGGHALGILERIGAQGKLIAIDCDRQSLECARARLSAYAPQIEFVHENFRQLDNILKTLRIESVDGILFDLGVSGFQLDNPKRGFSFQNDGPLDMRLNQESMISAYDLINSLSEKELCSLLKNYGEERYAKAIAKGIISKRAVHPIESSQELKELILQSVPGSYRKQKIHPATRTFQAVRIAVNQELESLGLALEKSRLSLKPSGRICVISFHSLEDRIVKNSLRLAVQSGQMKWVVKKPLIPQPEEIQANPRARSARLRVAERIV